MMGISKSGHFGGDSVDVTGACVTGSPPSILRLSEEELGALGAAVRNGPAC
jgi:hypothetical protein